MQLGFVIDHSRCIGCHACTVACKSENDVPLGNFRTWVKYTERGEFPTAKRHFAVLRCNQCTAAPCITICPTKALEKRDDGIVDINPDHCIGCKSCMQGCPYDALYIHPGHGTAQKCHFCAHRTEQGLAPACAVVCPTEAIIPGDFDDPTSVVARMKASGGLEARKTEAGTVPNVWYREVDPSGLRPLETNASGGYLWANRQPGAELDAEEFRALEAKAQPRDTRTTYDVEHNTWWGWRVSAYLVTKAIAAGAILAALPALLGGATGSENLGLAAVGAGLLFLLITTVLLVADLKRPERFLLILLRPNWSSWLVRGTVILMAYGGLLSLWLALALLDKPLAGTARTVTLLGLALLGAGAAGYTGALFGQCKGRVLWMQRHLWLALIVRAVAAGGAFLCVLSPFLEGVGAGGVRYVTAIAAAIAVVWELASAKLAPRGREIEYEEAHRLLTRGPFKGIHGEAIAFIGLANIALVTPDFGFGVWMNAFGGLALIFALWRSEQALVKAGQALPIS